MLRLSLLCLLRKLYRNLLRADALLAQPTPLCQQPSLDNGAPRHPHGYYPKRLVAVDDAENNEEARERRDAAVEVLADMRLTSQQLRVRSVPGLIKPLHCCCHVLKGFARGSPCCWRCHA